MEINKQLFEDVLAGKLKGTFVLRNGDKVKSSKLSIDTNKELYYPISLNYHYTYKGEFDFRTNSIIDIIDFIPETNMKENELTIEIPDNKVVDWDESKKQNKIVLKDKRLTYEEICRSLFENGLVYYTTDHGNIDSITTQYRSDSNNATTEHQLECILAKNKLANVAVYLNNGWKPSGYIFGYFICVCGKELEIRNRNDYKFNNNIIFKTKELTEKAIEILGEETVKLALEPLGI